MVTEVHVADGDAIAAGSPVATVSRDAAVNGAGSRTVSLSDLMTEASDREEEALARSRAAQMEVQDRAREEVDAKRQGFRRESALLRANLELQSERVKLATATVEAARTLHQRELLSTLSLRQREEALIAARQSEHMLLLEVAKVESNLSQLEAEERRILASERQVTADAAIEGAKLQGRRAGLSADKAIVLTAQKSGRVAALQARPGIPVQAGSTLAIILPDRSRLQAELWVPSRAVGFVTVGTAVRLMYDAFPYQKFGVGKGRVVSVARAPTEPGELPIANDGREALYKVVVALENDGMGAYGQRWSLAPGMRLTADLLSENRSFWEWVFEPIIAATKRNSSS
jgi:membrane fusion protein